MWSFTPRMTELVIKNGCHTHINAEKWSGENLTNLTACYGHGGKSEGFLNKLSIKLIC